jgi:hypothetical protein
MAHAAPHRNVTVKIPAEDFKRLEDHAARVKKSKNALVRDWLAPALSLLRSCPHSAGQAE